MKNENNILPINPQKYKHIIVTGKNAHGYVHGGGSGAVVPFHYTNLFDGIQKEGKLNNVKVEYIDESSTLCRPSCIQTTISTKRDFMPNTSRIFTSKEPLW